MKIISREKIEGSETQLEICWVLTVVEMLGLIEMIVRVSKVVSI